MGDIDIVMMWVDGGDEDWVKERSTYEESSISKEDAVAISRQYRNWDNLQYVFRGIEEFMPWVRKIHFVTNGQKPEWLNLDNPKLNFVKHSDFMPLEYLPSFSARAIEVNMHRVKGLADRFVFFNDDMFVTKKTKPTDFFSKEGLPKDQAVLFRIPGVDHVDMFGHMLLNDIGVINRNFDRNKVLKKYFSKFFSIKNGVLSSIVTASYLPTNHFPGFMINHMPQAYLKSTFIDVWDKESDVLHATSLNKIRAITDVNQYLMREWQMVTGNFEPTNLLPVGKYFSIFPKQLDNLTKAIVSKKYRFICINDVEVGEFEVTKERIIKSFEEILPNKSDFEI